MILGARQSLWVNNINQLFVDPSKCKDYIVHSSESDTALIQITQFANKGNGGPYTSQLIIQSLQTTSVDRKFLKVCDINNGEVLTMHIIGR